MRSLEQANSQSFSYQDLFEKVTWQSYTPTENITFVGAETLTGRFIIIGPICFVQVQFSGATSVATTAGTTYITCPKTAKGLGGTGTMVNSTANTAVGSCVIDVTNSRCYLPTQAASANSFTVTWWYEVN